MTDPISISCASDAAYYCGLLVTLHSLVSHAAAGTRLVVHVLDTGLAAHQRTDLAKRLGAIEGRTVSVTFHTVDASRFEGLPKWRGGYAAYVRLFLQDILADEDFTVYTDVDTLWLRDVSELWSMRARVPVLAAVPDGSGLASLSSGARTATLFAERGRPIDPAAYFCSGLFLMNLRALRERGFSSAWMDFLRNNPRLLDFPDQNLYNWFFPAPDTVLLDWRWGEFAAAYGRRETASPRVIHYAKAAPWKAKLSAVGMLWWDYVRAHLPGTPWHAAARQRHRLFRLMRNPVVFALVYAPAALFNRKVWRKRKTALHPEVTTHVQDR